MGRYRQTVAYLVLLVSSVMVLWCIYQTQFSLTEKPTARCLNSSKKAQLAPCGSVCSYDGAVNPQKPYPYIAKPIDCTNIMKRMAWTGHNIINPPPKQPPAAQIREFTQNGECPLGKPLYKNGINPGNRMRKGYPKEYIVDLITKNRNGERMHGYKDGWTLANAIEKHRRFIKGAKGFVMGTERPWIEAIMVSNGASYVTTVEHRSLVFEHPNMTAMHPYDFAEGYIHGKTDLFDFGASYSSIEHSGLGRYGDPLNPFGDMEAMAQAFCMTKPGGIYFLGVPYSNNCTVLWNAHRVYSPVRLQHLTANWKVIDIDYNNYHVLVVLQKSET